MCVKTKMLKVKIFVLLLSFLSSSKPAKEDKRNLTESLEHEVLYIGGLFAIHTQSKNRTLPCGSFRLGGFEELNAMLFAVSKINENDSILPGIKLQVKTEDTCDSMERATEKSLDYTIINYHSIYECFGFGNHSAQDRPILAIVGGRTSDVSRAVTNLVGLFHIPLVSYGATSPSLSGVKYFTRTVPPDTFVAQALIDVLQRFKWNYIILLYSSNEYGRFAADSFRDRLRKEKKNICTAVDEQINEDDTTEVLRTWEKIHKEKLKTKVVVLFATFEDFIGFLKTGKKKYDVEEYIWLSSDMWNGRTDNLTCMLKHALCVVPHQIYVDEFAQFFHNAQKNLRYLKQHSTIDEKWYKKYNSLAATENSSIAFKTKSGCISWGSSEVSYVMDAVYTIAWALHGILKCDSASKSCNISEAKKYFKSELLDAIKSVNFQNHWTKNKISYTSNGNPRHVKYSIVSLKHEERCFVNVGQWDCLVDANETCTGNVSLEDAFTSEMKGNFLGVCGTLCPAGQYKFMDTHFASCCWQCKSCTSNKYSTKPGSTACKACKKDEWPIHNHTACTKVKPKMVYLTDNPAGIILLCVNIVSVKILTALIILIIKYSQSKMKVFSDRILCFPLMFGILMCNVVSILVLTDTHRQNCLLMAVLSKLGSTLTLGTIFIKTNDVYRTYKKKILKGDPRYLSEALKVMVVTCLVIIDLALLWFSINFEGKNRKTSMTVYFPTETENTAYVHCGIIIDFLTGEIFTVLETSFYWALLLICTHQSYLTRKVTDHGHGLRYVFFGSLALSVNSVTTMLARSFTDNKGNKKELMYSFFHLFFAAVALACIFIPKVEILVFHPERDVLFDALRVTVTSNQGSMISMRKRKISDAQNPSTSNAPDS